MTFYAIPTQSFKVTDGATNMISDRNGLCGLVRRALQREDLICHHCLGKSFLLFDDCTSSEIIFFIFEIVLCLGKMGYLKDGHFDFAKIT